MNIVCTHCAHEFEMADEALGQTGGSTPCPSCGEETSLGSVPSGATLPWHPGLAGMPGMPPIPGESATEPVADPREATPEPDSAAPVVAPRPREQSVLFKLGGIQAMAEQTTARQGGGPPEASGLIDIRMLAATIMHHEEQMRSAHNVQFVGRVKPSAQVALPTSSPSLAMAPAGNKGKGGLIAAAVVFGVLIVAAVVLVYFVYAGKKAEGGDADKQASVATSAMTPSMGAAVMDAQSPAMRPEAMEPSMRPMGMDAMEPSMAPAIMKSGKPEKRPRKLYRKHIREGVATVADRIAACKKDRKGRFKLRITVVGKTGKVKSVRVSGRRQRKSKTGKCLKALFEKAQFTPFTRRRQAFTHRVWIK